MVLEDSYGTMASSRSFSQSLCKEFQGFLQLLARKTDFLSNQSNDIIKHKLHKEIKLFRD